MDIHFQVDGEVVHSNAMDNKHNLENIEKYWPQFYGHHYQVIGVVVHSFAMDNKQKTENIGEYWRIQENFGEYQKMLDTI